MRRICSRPTMEREKRGRLASKYFLLLMVLVLVNKSSMWIRSLSIGSSSSIVLVVAISNYDKQGINLYSQGETGHRQTIDYINV